MAQTTPSVSQGNKRSLKQIRASHSFSRDFWSQSILSREHVIAQDKKKIFIIACIQHPTLGFDWISADRQDGACFSSAATFRSLPVGWPHAAGCRSRTPSWRRWPGWTGRLCRRQPWTRSRWGRDTSRLLEGGIGGGEREREREREGGREREREGERERGRERERERERKRDGRLERKQGCRAMEAQVAGRRWVYRSQCFSCWRYLSWLSPVLNFDTIERALIRRNRIHFELIWEDNRTIKIFYWH